MGNPMFGADMTEGGDNPLYGGEGGGKNRQTSYTIDMEQKGDTGGWASC